MPADDEERAITDREPVRQHAERVLKSARARIAASSRLTCEAIAMNRVVAKSAPSSVPETT